MQTNKERADNVIRAIALASKLADGGLLRAEEAQFRVLSKALSLVDVEWLRKCGESGAAPA